ncbi:isopropylmalate/homocitrate/citramalate synthase [Spirosoma sp. HMF3257]|uniref:Isopropylmalate/homocitrate/citramalate synthase n=1 Tax=Spirosoma telluris TaxID=2183553 RepID=A0A327NR30_9BACT|nr:isopropylmalate/homocitrate/citramalate synthase [Spirosoma telluris]RAI76416.1 isopropylmalate/homocitrate/citramalate synthase [Spirosoma telluris]
MTSFDTISHYYDAFNRKDWEAMLSLLHPNVRHDSNQGATRIGKEIFSQFLQHMDDCYDETLTDIVVMTEPTGTRVACEFVVSGVYKKTDGDLPAATGQTYVLPAGSFLEVADGLITRVTTYYNLPLWESLVLGN